ncbi:diketogulonate reductase-like aldo/keto reductase [Brevundimonas nasdae]|uniref:aldo/keto reductase n=1 Tax=Brevundimonas nasdae TaxID=172043 RepID=UPI0019138534|nr:aldo/keto reductase [Brevundimonas nasdae]MBK6025189.1 aldo/keto reductase [Brevundimonas nasdae]MDQ0452029.1 diketogulonate reductase-like aldo/keto reductase [Brevundimonas nasdae]
MTRLVTFADGTTVPALGQGTWEMGDDPAWRDAEQQALERGIDLGMTLIDTAELYGDGRSERLVGEVIAGRRDEVFIVSKVRPENASEMKMMLSCEKSLERLGIDRIDLYLLHWEGRVPLEETVDAFRELVDEGMIARWGVSNLDLRTMERLMQIDGAEDCASNQLLYNLGSRGIEYDLLPWMQSRDMPMMAYSPLGRGGLLEHPLIVDIADRHSAEPAQVALAAVLRNDGIIAIPKASSVEHVEANADALEIQFDIEDLERLDQAFPPRTQETPLEII